MTTEIIFFTGEDFQHTIAECIYPYAQYAVASTDGERVVALREQIQARDLPVDIRKYRTQHPTLVQIVMPQQLVNSYWGSVETLCSLPQGGKR